MNTHVVMPRKLVPGDKVRFVSPASTPDYSQIMETAKILEGWGLQVDFGENAFKKLNYLAGTDEERLHDFDAALRDPNVRAIFATKGGKGSYRIADRIDFDAARKDPKFLVGFSDITILHLALWKMGIGGAIHGSLKGDDRDGLHIDESLCLKDILMGSDNVVLRSLAEEQTSALTTKGRAEGPLIGGNLDMVATGAGWALPPLQGCILLLEAVNMFLGQVDRQLTMLRKGGHLDGLAGIAIGQFTDFKPSGTWTIVDLLREHLMPLGVPILGGLPLGHGENSLSIPMGHPTMLNATGGELTVLL